MNRILRGNRYQSVIFYFVCCLSLLSCLFSLAQASDNPYLVKDINTDQSQSHSDPQNLAVVGSVLYFTATDGNSNRNLWKSDGTPGGTVVVKEFNSTPDPHIYYMTDMNGILFFSGTDGTNNGGFWRSDGTPDGTFMIKELWATDITNVNGTLFFSAGDSANGLALWKSDGTSDGTVMVKHMYSYVTYSEEIANLTNINGTLFFGAGDGVNGYGLWKSDGTFDGTVLVKDVIGRPSSLTNVNGTLFFVANGGIWRSDGTPDGTLMVKNISTGGDPMCQLLTVSNGILFFIAADWGYFSLWRSDGTADGTFLISKDSFPSELIDFNGILFFVAYNPATGASLWKSDGTPQGTIKVKDFMGTIYDPPSIYHLTNVNGTLFFLVTSLGNGYALWKSDGTSDGTMLAKTFSVQDSGSWIDQLVNVNGTLFFAADDGVHGKELWRSDGTPSGTVMVKDINIKNLSSGPHDMVDVNGTLFFAADDSVHGTELWRSDGTSQGTTLVKDVLTGWGSDPAGLTNVDGTLFFTANSVSYGESLWKSDGTADGTLLLKDFKSFVSYKWAQRIDVNGTLFLTLYEAANGYALWKSDGTPEGTVSIRNFRSVDQLTDVNGTLFFTADDGTTYGQELWKSDGTPQGTVLVKNVTPGWEGPSNLIDLDGTLFFTADGTGGRYADTELWKSDGTPEGTAIFKDINTNYGRGSNPANLTNVNEVLFFTASDGVHGNGVWKSDGTPDGTIMIKEITASNLTDVNGTLFFIGWDGVTGGLWKSDGTESGTVMISEWKDGAILFPNVIDNVLYFLTVKNYPEDWRVELWKSDGTSDGTVMIQPICIHCFYYELASADGTLFFPAADPILGVELWAYIPPPNAPLVSGKTLTNNATPTWSWISGGGSGDGNYRYQLDSDTGAWTETTALSFTPGGPLADGGHTLYVQERKKGKVWSVSGSKTTIIDTVPPVGSLAINGGTKTTRSASVRLTLSASDPSGVSQMCISNTTSCTSWVTYASTRSWTLSYGNGTKTVYVWYRDKAGNKNTTPYSASITLDTTAPTNGTVTATPGNGQVTLTWTGFADSVSDIAGYKVVYATGSAPSSCSAGTAVSGYDGVSLTYTHLGLTNGTTYGYRVCAIDKAGNISTGSTAKSKPVPEIVPPTGSIVINGGAAATKSATVTLTLTASDDSPPIEMCISNTSTCSVWTTFITTKAWTLLTGNGIKTVRVWFRDAWGNTTPSSTVISDTIILDTTAPTNGSVTATPGVGQVSLGWTNFSDAVSGITGYKVVFATGSVPTSCSSGTVIDTFDKNTSSYVHDGRASGTAYYYRVCAIDNAGNISTGATASARAQ